MERAFDVLHSKLVEHARAIHADIELHKWYESERAGHDIGWERAVVDWLCKGHADKFTIYHPCTATK
jgi:hypothetical protein